VKEVYCRGAVTAPVRSQGSIRERILKVLVADVRANLRRLVRRVLRHHGYPPDKQEQATLTVLEQAEAVARDWAGA
jgi:Domain of unknown function (DUF3387)